MRILIVDDDTISSMITSDTFSEFGECTIIDNSIEAVSEYKRALYQGQPYDLICLDIVLPVYSGFKVLEEIRLYEKANNISPAVKIVMVSGYNGSEIVDKALKEGADYFFKKPLDIYQIQTFMIDNFNKDQ